MKTFAISPFTTSGPGPGWVHRHTAELTSDGSAVIVRGGRVESARNINDWRLGLDTGRWEQLTFHPWQVWQVQREDGNLLHLWQIRSQLALESMGQPDLLSAQARQFKEQFNIPTLEEELGGPVDSVAASELYRPPVDHEPVLEAGDFQTHRIRVNGVTICYEEDLQGIEVTFEGALPQKVINAVVKDLQSKLARLEGKPCTAKQALA